MLSASTTATTLGDSVSSQYSARTLAPSGYSHCSLLATPSWKVKPGLVLSNVTNNIDLASFPTRCPTADLSLSTATMMPREQVSRIPIRGTFSKYLVEFLRELRQPDVRRITFPRTRVNKGKAKDRAKVVVPARPRGL